MTKTATTKRKSTKTSAIRNRLLAAICMLLISSIMLVSSTYAWFTLSTAPEAKGIDTSVAGNGSLEIALMPGTGLLGDIVTGRSGMNGGGTKPVPEANITWGNLITLSDEAYGLQKIELKPLNADRIEQGAEADMNFGAPVFAYDGRIEKLEFENVGLLAYDSTAAKFNKSEYGVRAIVNDDTTYGYIIDLAFRVNAAKDDGTDASLILQKEGIQRIYNGTGTNVSSSEITQGAGSYLQFSNTSALGDAIRIAFVQNFGNGADGVTSALLAYGKVDTDGKLQLFNYENNVETEVEDNVLLTMAKNTTYQISVIVWLDGADVTNKNFSATELSDVTLNLQFATDIELIPALDVDLRDNPPAPATTAENATKDQITAKLTEMAAVLMTIRGKAAADRTEEESNLLTAATNAGLVVQNGAATQDQINEAYAALVAAYAAYTAANP